MNIPKVKVKLVRQMVVVNGYEIDVDMVNKFAMVVVPGECYSLKIRVEEIDKLKQALNIVKDMLEYGGKDDTK